MAEGTSLLRMHTAYTCIVGSNPTVSARTNKKASPAGGFFICLDGRRWIRRPRACQRGGSRNRPSAGAPRQPGAPRARFHTPFNPNLTTTARRRVRTRKSRHHHNPATTLEDGRARASLRRAKYRSPHAGVICICLDGRRCAKAVDSKTSAYQREALRIAHLLAPIARTARLVAMRLISLKSALSGQWFATHTYRLTFQRREGLPWTGPNPGRRKCPT